LSVTSTSGAEELAHQSHGSGCIALSLHKYVENLAFIVDRAPQPEPLFGNHHGHLVEMPLRSWLRPRRRRSSPANIGPNFRTHRRTVS
jgi:hypothetical protein